ncbi:MAG: hypothetical protein N3G20_05570, partial [Verrucomicrobiae bacterium]|nr:hypothetical protein [Verrucomicrobiae bacterium]
MNKAELKLAEPVEAEQNQKKSRPPRKAKPDPKVWLVMLFGRFGRARMSALAVALAVSFRAPPTATPASVVPTNLKCEYLENPVGVDTTQPRLSWVLVPRSPTARGQRQTAYQVLVASNAEALERNKGDLWDSGWVKSDESQQIVYNGRPLWSNQECYWKVRVRDEHGKPSQWSKPARWVTGILDPSNWS